MSDFAYRIESSGYWAAVPYTRARPLLYKNVGRSEIMIFCSDTKPDDDFRLGERLLPGEWTPYPFGMDATEQLFVLPISEAFAEIFIREVG